MGREEDYDAAYDMVYEAIDLLAMAEVKALWVELVEDDDPDWVIPQAEVTKGDWINAILDEVGMTEVWEALNKMKQSAVDRLGTVGGTA